MPKLRIRLNFDGVLPGKARKCWFLVDTSTCRVVADLEYLIQERFGLRRRRSISVITLYLQGFLLPSQEKIEVIRDNDVLRVVEGTYLSKLGGGNAIDEDNSKLGSSDEGNTVVQPKIQKLQPSRETQRTTSANTKSARVKKKSICDKTGAKIKNKRQTKTTSVAKPQTLSKQKQNTENINKTKNYSIRQSNGRTGNPSNPKVHNPDSSGSESDTSSSDSSSQSSTLSNLAPPSPSASSSSSSASSSSTASSSSLSDSKKESHSSVPIASKQLLHQHTNGENMSESNPNQIQSSVGARRPQNNMVRVRNFNSHASNGHIRFSSGDESEAVEQITTDNGSANVEVDQNSDHVRVSAAAANIVQNDLSGKSSQLGEFLLQQNLPGQHSKGQKKKDNTTVNSRVSRDQLRETHSSSINHDSNHIVTTGCTAVQGENAAEVRQITGQQTGNTTKEPNKRDYSCCTPLHGPPRVGDRVAFKIVELSSSYTPEVSDYKEGVVLGYDVSSGLVELDLTRESLVKPLGDGNVSSKFELVYEDEDDCEGGDGTEQVAEQSTKVSFTWSDMMELRLIT